MIDVPPHVLAAADQELADLDRVLDQVVVAARLMTVAIGSDSDLPGLGFLAETLRQFSSHDVVLMVAARAAQRLARM